MEKTKVISLISLLALIGFVSSVEELKYQTVPLNGWIKQYAIINVIGSDSGNYFSYCQDCIANATVTDTAGNVILNNVVMTSLSPGLFGVRADSIKFKNGFSYKLMVITHSDTYGDGVIYSDVFISSTSPDSFSATAGQDVNRGVNYSYVPEYSCSISDPMSCLFGMFNVMSDLTGYFLSNNEDSFVGDLRSIFSVGSFGLLGDIYNFISDISVNVTMFFKFLIDILSSDDKVRTAAFKDFLSLYAGIMVWLATIFMAPIVLIEFFIVFASIEGSFTQMMGKIIMYHERLFKKFFDFFMGLWGFIRDIVTMIGGLIP